jgi:hypothetical protein
MKPSLINHIYQYSSITSDLSQWGLKDNNWRFKHDHKLVAN